MANYQLFNDTVAKVPVQFQNSSGVQPQPSGESFTVTNAHPTSVGAVMNFSGANNVGPALVLTPLVQASPGLSVTVSDNFGRSMVFTFDIVADPNALVMAANVAGITVTNQAVPSAPGP